MWQTAFNSVRNVPSVCVCVGARARVLLPHEIKAELLLLLDSFHLSSCPFRPGLSLRSTSFSLGTISKFQASMRSKASLNFPAFRSFFTKGTRFLGELSQAMIAPISWQEGHIGTYYRKISSKHRPGVMGLVANLSICASLFFGPGNCISHQP